MHRLAIVQEAFAIAGWFSCHLTSVVIKAALCSVGFSQA
jgi:hypothetical protein